MLAAKLNSTRSGFDLLEVEEPSAGTGECLVEVAACGICASDLRFLAGKGDARPGTTLGHEATGTVVECGEGVEAALAGRAVAINPLISCGECAVCRAGLTNRCPERHFIGIHRDGAFAERVAVPAGQLVELPAGADLVATALSEPFSVARHALGDPAASVAVIGAGGIGLGAILLARARGAERVLAFDLSEAALRRARDCGALTPGASDPEPVEQVVDCTGAGATLAADVELLAPGGELVLVGIVAGDEFPAEAFVRAELRARGAFAYTPAEFEEVALAIGSGELEVAAGGAETVPLAEIATAIEQLRSEPGAHSRFVLVPRES